MVQLMWVSFNFIRVGTTIADETVSFIIPRTKGGYVIGLGRSLSLLDWDAGSAQKVVEVESRGTKNRFNDAKCDASGRLWAGNDVIISRYIYIHIASI